jgi:hypothetical protein
MSMGVGAAKFTAYLEDAAPRILSDVRKVAPMNRYDDRLDALLLRAAKARRRKACSGIP